MSLIKNFVFLIGVLVSQALWAQDVVDEKVNIPIEIRVATSMKVQAEDKVRDVIQMVTLVKSDASITQLDMETLEVTLAQPVRYDHLVAPKEGVSSLNFLKTFQLKTNYSTLARIMDLTYADLFALESFRMDDLIDTYAIYEVEGVESALQYLLEYEEITGLQVPLIARPQYLSIEIEAHDLQDKVIDADRVYLVGENVSDPIRKISSGNEAVWKLMDGVIKSYPKDSETMKDIVGMMTDIYDYLQDMDSKGWLAGLANGNWEITEPVEKLIKQSDNIIEFRPNRTCNLVFAQ